jgi:hypothetical protein
LAAGANVLTGNAMLHIEAAAG